MSCILACLAVLQQAGSNAGYASPGRRFAVIALSGCYVAIVGWWAGGKVITAWRERDRDSEDQLG